MLKKRIVNIRVMFAIFVGLMFGILFPYLLFKNVINFTALLIISISLLLVVISLWIYAELTHKYNKTIRHRENVSPLIKGASLGFVLSFVIGIFIMFAPIVSIFSITDYGNNEVTVSGVVSDYVDSEATYKKFIVDKCVINSGTSEKSIDYKICVYTTNFIDVSLGDKISFTGVLDKYEFSKSSDFSKLMQKIGYSVFVDYANLTIEKGSQSLKDIIKDKTKDVLDENLNEDNANISYAILFGEKQGLSENLSEMFSYAGISHILAVSGLHIGVLVSFIYMALKKIRINKYVRISLLGVILLFYSYLCSFTPSVCRASIMAMISALCDLLMIENDGLSSLSIAGIIILLFNPLSLFSISFQLSFLCLFSIISLAPTLTKILRKLRLPEFLSSSLAVSVATNLAILPVCLNSFTKVSMLGILTNIIVLPIFSIVYVLIFSIVVLSLIWSRLGIFLVVPNLFLHIIKSIANFVSSIDFGIFRVFSITYWALFLIIIVSLILHFLMAKKVFKGSVSFVLLIVIIGLFINSATPNNYSRDNIIFSLKYNSNLCYYVNDNEVTLIGSNIENNLLMSEMKKLKMSKINTIIAYDLQLNNLSELLDICEEFEVKNVYIPKKFEYTEIKEKFDSPVFFTSNVIINNLNFKAIYYSEQIIGVYLYVDSLGSVLIPEIKPTKAEAKHLMEYYANIDYIYLNSDETNIDLTTINADIVITNNESSGDIELEKMDNYIINEMTAGVSNEI